MDFGFLKIGAFSPRTCVANPKQNAIYTLDALRHAQEEGVQGGRAAGALPLWLYLRRFIWAGCAA